VQVVTAWNGMAISALALAGRALCVEQPSATRCFPVEGRAASEYLAEAARVIAFARAYLCDTDSGRLRRSFCRGTSAVYGFSSDYVYLIAGAHGCKQSLLTCRPAAFAVSDGSSDHRRRTRRTHSQCMPLCQHS
jgi:uncharacterized protein YyaL (SSP411 family)